MIKIKDYNKLLVLLGIVVFLGLVSTPQTAMASASPIGVVDYGFLINQHPDTSKANEALRADNEVARKEFSEKLATMSDQEKQNLDRQLMQRLEQKRQQLLKPIIDSINTAMKAVSDAKGLTVVVYKNNVALGGTDITEDVLKKITGK